MLTSSSQHVLSVREIHASTSRAPEKARAHINFQQFIEFISHHRSAAKGETSRPLSSSSTHSSRRTRDSVLVRNNGKSQEEVLNHADHNVPVWQHSWGLQYTSSNNTLDNGGSFIDIGAPWERKFVDEENQFIEFLRAENEEVEIDEFNDTKVFDFQDIYFIEGSGSFWICSTPQKNTIPAQIIRLPPLKDPTHEEDLDYRYTTNSLLQMAEALVLENRASVELSMQLAVLSTSLVDHEELPFRIVIKMVFSLTLPSIFEKSFKSLKSEEAQRRLLAYVFGKNIATSTILHREMDVPHFLSILRPAPNLASKSALDAVQPPLLHPTLLPFQRRSVGWLLEREGKTINESGEITYLDASKQPTPLFWTPVSITDDMTWYYNRLYGLLLPDFPQSEISGGILAEEPGLGKTLECIALILLNPAENRTAANTRWDPHTRLEVKETKTTLIVTPQALATQWAEEVALHAPSLKVLKYEGWHKIGVPITPDADSNEQKVLGKRKKIVDSTKSRKKGKTAGSNRDREETDAIDEIDYSLDWCRYINQFDICITTYNVLQQDLGVARAPVVRPRREVGNYSNLRSSRSPLVMSEWYRVVMDEVQMVGGGKAEEMVALIPRISSFAVSGTPARAKIADLSHVLKFLRVDDAVSSSKIWARLIKPAFRNEFESIFSKLAIRTTKAQVKSELTIPEQKRFLMPIELGRIERHVYDQNLEQALIELGLDARGVAANEGWQINVPLLRSWVRKLRGICTHPQVGQLFKPNDRTIRPGTLKTLGDVLDNMKDESWRTMMNSRKSKVQALIKHAQLMQHHENDVHRYRNALDILSAALDDVKSTGSEIQKAIAEHEAKGQILKEQHAERFSGRKGNSSAPSGATDDDLFDFAHSVAGEEFAGKRQSLVSLHREYLILQHRVHFLLGDVYHMLGSSYSVSEDEAYTAADNTRKQLLKVTEDAAKRSMAQLNEITIKNTPSTKEINIEHCGKGGVRSGEPLKEANKIIDVLNDQASLLLRWRGRIIEILTADLSASGENVDGEEYARTLDMQGEAEAYLQAYTALLADRREILVAERTVLAAHDTRERKLRHTKAAMKAAAALDRPEILERVEMEPEHEVLRGELMTERKALLNSSGGRAIKSIIVDLSSIVSRIVSETDQDKVIARESAKTLRRLITDQTKLHERFDNDLAQFRKTFNDRVEYFRQLQQLSDSVIDVEWEGNVLESIAAAIAEVQQSDAGIKRDAARYRYLDYMAQTRDEQPEDEDKLCILCRCEFKRGFITQCAHVFCEECLKAWLSRKEGKACPVCRVIIDVERVQRVSLEEKEEDNSLKSLHPSNDGPPPKSRRVIRYNIIEGALYDEIKNVECHGDYGSKIETLVRHLLYVQQEDLGAKSIIFSAWADSLSIIEHALTLNGVPSIRIDQQRNAIDVFKSDPSLLVLLLHGERENAGLNVTCASRVFLLESVVQHSFELQAIARIDRMGQTRPTEVYCYYAEDTVEKNILDLAARQGISLYTQDRSSGSLDITSYTLKAEEANESLTKRAKQKGDFIMKTDDMLAVLFPHMFEDVEYLLPSAAIDDVDCRGSARFRGRGQIDSMQPVAGPSRLQ